MKRSLSISVMQKDLGLATVSALNFDVEAPEMLEDRKSFLEFGKFLKQQKFVKLHIQFSVSKFS